MRPSIALQIHRDAIRKIVLSYRVKNVRVSGLYAQLITYHFVYITLHTGMDCRYLGHMDVI
ncbi:MAG: hypothetical protein ACXV8U_15485 [Methylobacter sp.]